VNRSCDVWECDKRGRYEGLCLEHYQVRHGHAPTEIHWTDKNRPRKPRPKPQPFLQNGYRYVPVPYGYPGSTLWSGRKWSFIAEHRKVMQDLIGRVMRPHENVHHKNGLRHDNRPENLELWVTSQPCGQRVRDKLDWARRFIAQYGSPAERFVVERRLKDESPSQGVW